MSPLQRDKRNILVGEVALFYAPVDTPQPADTVPLFEGWGADWVHPGYTEEGVTNNFERETQAHNVEEDPLPAFYATTTATFTIGTSFAENTLENMRVAHGGGVINVQTNATTNAVEKRTLVLSAELEELAVGFEGRAPSGQMRRIIIPRVVSVGSVETANRRAESKRLLPVEFQSLCQLNEIYIADTPIPATA